MSYKVLTACSDSSKVIMPSQLFLSFTFSFFFSPILSKKYPNNCAANFYLYRVLYRNASLLSFIVAFFFPIWSVFIELFVCLAFSSLKNEDVDLLFSPCTRRIHYNQTKHFDNIIFVKTFAVDKYAISQALKDKKKCF